MSIKTKRDEFEMQLLSVYPVDNTKLYDALESALEEANEIGFNEAVREIANGTFKHPALEAIQARYEYLKKSGQWQRETTGDLYVRGFEDAMKVLGLLPMVGP